jgi:hypothetical protein
MKKKSLIFGILVCLLIFSFGLTGCDNGSGGSDDDSGSKGTLTIENCPQQAHVYICTNSTPTTMMDFTSKLTSFLAQNLETFGSSPFSLAKFGSISVWTGSGKYLIIVVCDPSTGNAFKADVSFKNGSATIDYNDMTKESTLPLGL